MPEQLACSITGVAAALATLPELQFVNLGFNMLDGQLDRACNLTTTKACSQHKHLQLFLTGSWGTRAA